MGHYVAVGKNFVEVQRWDQRQTALERYSNTSICNNFEEFHLYLEKDVPKQGVSIVSHAISVFRSLRATLGKDYSGTDSLKVFLYLLASTTDGSKDVEFNPNDWAFSEKTMSIKSEIREADWNALQQNLICGRINEGLSPDISLLLRHASGQLFQEAHYEAIFGPNQLSFGGFLPSSIALSKKHEGIGVHFTPSALARTLVESALSECHTLSKNLTVFDPACGSGEFLREVLRQLELLGYDGKLKLVGWDISEAASDMARFTLEWEMRNSRINVDFEIVCVDSLAHDWPRNVDIILMNPPFTSWQDMDTTERENLKELLGGLITMRPDASYAFLWKAESCLGTEGVLGSIVPASLLDAASAKRLREKLAETLSPVLIARLGNPLMFRGALVDSALYVAKKDATDHHQTIAFWADHHASSSSSGLRQLRKSRMVPSTALPIVGNGFSIYKHATLGRDENSWAPRPYDSWKLLNSLNHLPRVKDLFEVKQGIRTGHNKAFLLDKDVWLNLPGDERKYFRPTVINNSIKQGFLFDITYVFYPYGHLRLKSEDELSKLVNSYYKNTLLKYKAELLMRARAIPDRWWELTLHRDWQIERNPKLVSTYFGDSGSFAWDDTGNYVVSQGYAWLPRNHTQLSKTASLAYLAILNSQLFSELLSATSNHVGGGQWNLSTKFVDLIAIPDLTDLDIKHSSVGMALSKIGEHIHSHGMDDVDKELLEEMVRTIYQTGIS